MKLHQSLDDASKGEDVVRDVLDVSDAAARIRTWEPLRDETLNLAPFPSLATAAQDGSLGDVEKDSRGGKVTWPHRPSWPPWPSSVCRSTRRRTLPTSACSSRKASGRS